MKIAVTAEDGSTAFEYNTAKDSSCLCPGLQERPVVLAALDEATRFLSSKPAMTDAQVKHMVDRFLSWKLPENFNPDNGISFSPIAGEGGPHPFKREPSGTNLLDAKQATEMVRHMIEGIPEE